MKKLMEQMAAELSAAFEKPDMTPVMEKLLCQIARICANISATARWPEPRHTKSAFYDRGGRGCAPGREPGIFHGRGGEARFYQSESKKKNFSQSIWRRWLLTRSFLPRLRTSPNHCDRLRRTQCGKPLHVGASAFRHYWREPEASGKISGT